MDWMKRFSRRSFWWILFWNTLLCAGLNALGWLVLDRINAMAGSVMMTQAGEMSMMRLQAFINDLEGLRIFAATGVFVLALVFSVLTWLVLRASLKKLAVQAAPKPETARKPDEAAEKSARQRALDDQRRVLQLFSLLQREGRLMDFLAEDLSLYEDGQIGAAARGVQESCKKLIEKYFKPSPVLDQEEGERVTLEADFDPAGIKLTGRVSGKPPFTGVLRHRGWRAAKFELPTLVAQGDPRLISPAEVEIE